MNELCLSFAAILGNCSFSCSIKATRMDVFTAYRQILHPFKNPFKSNSNKCICLDKYKVFFVSFCFVFLEKESLKWLKVFGPLLWSIRWDTVFAYTHLFCLRKTRIRWLLFILLQFVTHLFLKPLSFSKSMPVSPSNLLLITVHKPRKSIKMNMVCWILHD